MKLISTLFAALMVTAASAYADPGIDNHEEGNGHMLNEVRKHKPTAAEVKQERELQKNLDRDKNNHEEGVGGHALHELKKMPPATKESLAKQREADKTLDRGKDNHEEGVGGHGLYEATKGK
ncbi:MAG: hypothetical protein JSR83_00315 [Proteobacteria bacterium]|nr:hypothetical protein [Pseudomonadota bacterium]